MDKSTFRSGAWLALPGLLVLMAHQPAAAQPPDDLTSRIVGGKPAAAGDWPSVLSIVNTFPIPSAFTRHYCGATLIAPSWVMTAAHCLFEGTGSAQLRPDQLRVVGGVVNLEQAVPEDEVMVLNLFVHPGYDNSDVSSPDDIALIELAEPIDLPVMSLYDDSKTSLDDLPSHIVGWGAVSGSGAQPDFSADQQVAQVPIVSQETCNLPASYDGLVGERQLCAGLAEGGVDACAGDSGGPLIIGIDGFQVQAGIVSFGSGCAEPGFYGIYTHVSAFADWIGSYVQADFRSAEEAPVVAPGSGDNGNDDDDEEGGEGASVGGIGGGTGGAVVTDESEDPSELGGSVAWSFIMALLAQALWRGRCLRNRQHSQP